MKYLIALILMIAPSVALAESDLSYNHGEPFLKMTVHLSGTGDLNTDYGNHFSSNVEGFSLNLRLGNWDGRTRGARRPDVSLTYMCHLKEYGDSKWLSEGEFCGTRGQYGQVEGFAVKLIGRDAGRYRIRYFCKQAGSRIIWMYKFSVRDDGEFCGSKGLKTPLVGMLVDVIRVGAKRWNK